MTKKYPLVVDLPNGKVYWVHDGYNPHPIEPREMAKREKEQYDKLIKKARRPRQYNYDTARPNHNIYDTIYRFPQTKKKQKIIKKKSNKEIKIETILKFITKKTKNENECGTQENRTTLRDAFVLAIAFRERQIEIAIESKTPIGDKELFEWALADICGIKPKDLEGAPCPLCYVAMQNKKSTIGKKVIKITTSTTIKELEKLFKGGFRWDNTFESQGRLAAKLRENDWAKLTLWKEYHIEIKSDRPLPNSKCFMCPAYFLFCIEFNKAMKTDLQKAWAMLADKRKELGVG